MEVCQHVRDITIYVDGVAMPYSFRIKSKYLALKKLKTFVFDAVGLTYQLGGSVIRVPEINELDNISFLLNEGINEYRALVLHDSNLKTYSVLI